MEIMRRHRVILERRSLPYSSSTSVGAASPANPRPHLPRRAASNVRPASFARPVHPRTARPSWPAAPVRLRAPPTAQPLTPMLFNQSILPELLISLVGALVEDQPTYLTPALPSEKLPERPVKHVLAPDPILDSSPSTIPPLPPTATTTSPSPPIANSTPVPSQADVPPAPSALPFEPPPAQPSTSQQHQSSEAGPSHCPSPVTSPQEPSHVPPSAPSGSAAGPSGSTAGPSQPPPPIHHYYCTAAPSEAGLQSRQDVPTIFLIMKGRWPPCGKKVCIRWNSCRPLPRWIDSLSCISRVTELELQLMDPKQASHALRAEIKDLTKKKNHLEVSLAHTNHKLKILQEEKSQVDVVHQQRMDQQALEHQRAIDQLTQKLRAAETLAQEQDKKLKSQAAQLTSQGAELLVARTELAQTRATVEGVSTALTIYKEGENDRCK
ncbi:formin-like protein 13 [Zingiber officinale]|uniref:formin-like protein 13 n=1 Tax=Zingiber officinale TaxID=94328 RepID=UPI001C4C055C|nr:formin-like protein 13 [Zingiber officinale]